jgi:CobQ/CobB/MinD/ParA nucleotide binding domain
MAWDAGAAGQGTGHVVAVCNLKGGTGKSTLSVNIACALANQGVEVALVDNDRQASATLWGSAGKLPITCLSLPLARLEDARPWLEVLLGLRAHYQVVIVDFPAGLPPGLWPTVLMASLILVPTSPNEIEIVATRSMLQRITVLRAARGSDPPALLVVPNRIVGAENGPQGYRASGRAGRGARTARPLPARARRGLRRAAVDRCRPSWLTCAPGRRNPGGAGAAQPGSGTATELAAPSGRWPSEDRPNTETAVPARYRSRPTGHSTGTASPAEGDCCRAEGGLPRRADDGAAAPERSRCGHQGPGHSPGRQPDASAAAASLREPV